jgi:predicted transcriptional regulator
MKSLSLKLENELFEETEKIISRLKKSRNRYINEAVEFYNLVQKRKLLKQKLHEESLSVRQESLKVLEEFEKF